MPSLIYLSDLHLSLDQPIARKDNAAFAQAQKFAYILDFAREKNCIILQAGDFFNSPRSWRALSFYANMICEYGIPPIYCVAGQHDDYMYNEGSRSTTALGVLETTRLLTILNDKPVSLDCGKKVNVYGCSYLSQDVPKVHKKSDLDILVIHAKISDTDLWAGAEQFYLAKNFLRRYVEFDVVLCGDIHKTFFVKSGSRTILNTGPLLRREASPDMFAHHPIFIEMDIETGKITTHQIPHLPAEDVLSREHIERPQVIEEALGDFIAAFQQGAHIIPSMQYKQNLVKYIQQNTVPEPVRKLITEVMEEE
jgi:hypothetical protein